MNDGQRTFLFLQGPISPFFERVAAEILEHAPTARILRSNLCYGDRLYWRRPGAVDYRGSLKKWPAFIDEFIEREGVTDILLLGEQRDYHLAAAAAAERHGAKVIATDFGYLRPDWIAFEFDGLTGASRFPRDPVAIRRIAAASPEPDLTAWFRDAFWAQSRPDIVYHMAASLLWFLYPGYKSHQPNHPIVTYLGTGLRLLAQGRRARNANEMIAAAEQHPGGAFVFPLQIARDFSIRAYSRFPDLETPIREVVASFAKHAAADAQLVLKIHPLDPGLISWKRIALKEARRHGIEERVKYIDGGDLGRLIRAASGVVVVNSTVGLMSLRQGAPTLALGQAIYDVPGMTAQCGLDEFWQAPPKPDEDLVRDFVRAIAGSIMVRGTFYSEPGLTTAVEGATVRLLEQSVNQPRMAAE